MAERGQVSVSLEICVVAECGRVSVRLETCVVAVWSGLCET